MKKNLFKKILLGTSFTIPMVLVQFFLYQEVVFAETVGVGVTVPAICGNGFVEGAEQCDDDNTNSNDGCSNVCAIEPPAVAGPVALPPPPPPPPIPDPIPQPDPLPEPDPVPDPIPEPDPVPDPLPEPDPVPDPDPVLDPQPNPNPNEGQVNPPDAGGQNNNPPVNNGNNNGSDAGAGIGGGSTVPQMEQLSLLDLNFWLSGKTFATTLNEGVLTSLSGDLVTIALPSHQLPFRAVAVVEFRLGGVVYPLIFQEGNGEYQGVFPMPPAGVYQGSVVVKYQDQLQDTLFFSVRALSFGTVRDESNKQALAEAKVTLFDESGVVQKTTVSFLGGGYGFVVPNGRYSLFVEKEGYRERRTPMFRVENSVVNQDIFLIPKTQSIQEAIASATTTASKVTAGITATGKKITEQTERAVQAVQDVVFQVNELADNPEVEQVAEQVVAPVAATAVATAVVPSLWSILFPLLRYLFLQPLLLFGKRKKTEWGMVYNSLTKLPVDLASVRLIDKKTGRVKQSRVTDLHGRYLFIPEPGEYILQVQKNDFVFPSVLMKGVHTDGNLVDVYHGEIIHVSDDYASVTPNIPLDPKGESQTPNRVIREKRFRIFQNFFSLFGIFLTLASLYVSPSGMMLGFLCLHIVVYVLFLQFVRPRNPKGWGIIYDKDTTQPLQSAVVRLFTKEYNKLVSTQVTDKKGRYAFLVGGNTYYLTSEKIGYQTQKSGEISVLSDKNQPQILKEDMLLQKQPGGFNDKGIKL